MLGVFVTALFTLGTIGFGRFLLSRWASDWDPAEKTGIFGLVGLGTMGLLTLFLGLLPDGLHWGLFVIGGIAVWGFVHLVQMYKAGETKFAKPEGINLLFVLAIGMAALFALVGVLAPSDTLDWDTLAYHLAVPKLWLQVGQIHFIPYIHHSNFPSTIEDLYVWGLTWGGQSGAKAFSLMYLVLGVIAIFGICRRQYSAQAAWWAALCFATVPVVMWESGTGYIDVAHGLYGGLGVLFVARWLTGKTNKSDLILAGVLLGFAAGTKYTGLQTIGVTGLVILIAMAQRKASAEGFKSALLVAGIAMVVSGSWYVKNVVQTGNPVYPFFYEKFGGKNWDQRRADVYREEQQKFGAGLESERHSPTQLGNAVLGLAYQPGRYVNPQEDLGLGTPLGAVGLVVIAGALIWGLSGRLQRFEVAILGVVGVSLLMWFFLSKQSRYVVPLTVPLAVLAGGAIAKLPIGRFLAGATVLQAAYSLGLVYLQRFDSQIQPVLGKVSAEEYQSHAVGFFTPSQVINKVAAKGKVALYDEVFGYLLDVPYMWANPPHCTVIPYDSMKTGDDYVAELKREGFTHVYINLSPMVKAREFVPKWIGAMGLGQNPIPFSDKERTDMMANWRDKWMVLLADAVATKKLTPVPELQKGGILFKIED